MAGRTRRVEAEQRREKLLSPAEIGVMRGSLKRKPGEKPFTEEWAEHKRQEMELEERRFREK